MLRLNRFEEPFSVRLRIDGLLTAESLAEVEQAWQEIVSRAHGRKLLLDASGVTRTDDAGIAFLSRADLAGAKVDDAGRFLQRSPSRAAAFAARLRQQLCAALCALVPTLHCPCGSRL